MSLDRLPDDLPVPQDDGACDHLPGLAVADVALPSTMGGLVNLASPASGWTIVYCYPRTGVPGQPLPTNWDAIPGARGCTPQSCAFRDHHAELAALDARVFGLSTQPTAYQREAAKRLHLPFALLSDESLAFCRALRLPTFEVDGLRLIRRLTLVIRSSRIAHVFYPVFPPDRSADAVLAWLRNPNPRTAN